MAVIIVVRNGIICAMGLVPGEAGNRIVNKLDAQLFVGCLKFAVHEVFLRPHTRKTNKK